jgi:phosphopantetheinyl transferase (holo-ACP synthase)
VLNPDWTEKSEEYQQIALILADLQTSTLTSIIEKVKKTLEEGGELTATAEWRIKMAVEQGLLYEEIVAAVALALNEALPVVARLFEQAALETIRDDNIVYEKAGKEPLRLTRSMANIVRARHQEFTGTLRRLTGTAATNGTELFERTLNTAFMETASGAFSIHEAVSKAADTLASEGISHFEYDLANGKRRKINVQAAVLMNLRTSLGQAAAAITEEGCKLANVEYVETSCHANQRNRDVEGRPWANHERWGGKIFKVNSWEQKNT